MEEDEDPIVDEVDVFLSKELMEKLYLFQYPMRPANKPYTSYNHLAARMKPKQKKVELDLTVDTATSCYARSKGEQIALNVDGPESTGEDAVFTSDLMDKQTLSSTDATPSSSRYAVGVIREGELHLTPINNIIQLRPSFNYLDRADAKVKKKNDKDKEDGDSNDEMEVKEEEHKTVKVQFVRKESDIAKARREASYAFHMEKLQQETWATGYYIDVDDPRSSREKEGLFCSAAESANDISQLSMMPKDYITKLIPESKSDDSAKAQMPSNVLSITQLQSMPLANQVRALLTNAKVMRFSQLLHYLSTSFDAGSILKPLQQVAVLVQGCWVIKSEVLYPKDTCSANTGVPAEILCRGRDYLMWKFTQSRYVIRKEIASTVKLLSEDVKEILEQMARPRVKQGWEFREAYDHDFVKHYPEVVDRQEKIWEAVHNQLSKVLKIPEEKRRKRKDSTETLEVVTGQERVKAARKRSRSISKPPTKANPPKAVLSNSEDPSRVRRPSLSEQDPTKVDYGDPTNHMEMDLGPLTSPETANHRESPVNEELRTFLRTLLQRHFEQEMILDIPEMRRYVSARLLESPHKSFFSNGISDRILEETAADAGAELLKIAWPPDVERKKLYAMVEGKDHYGKFRRELVQLYQDGFRFKRVLLVEAINSLEGGEQLTKVEREKIIKSVCIFKHHHWYLRGTMPAS